MPVNYHSRQAEAQEICSQIQARARRALAIQADVSKADEVSRLVREVEGRLGGIGILVNNAGISRPQPLEQITEQDWDEVLVINLKSMFLDASGPAGHAGATLVMELVEEPPRLWTLRSG